MKRKRRMEMDTMQLHGDCLTHLFTRLHRGGRTLVIIDSNNVFEMYRLVLFEHLQQIAHKLKIDNDKS